MVGSNMNEVACLVASAEGKVQELSIAQIKEVLHCLKQVCTGNTMAKTTVGHYLNIDERGN